MKRAVLVFCLAAATFFMCGILTFAEEGTPLFPELDREVGEELEALVPKEVPTDPERLAEALTPEGVLAALVEGVRVAGGEVFPIFCLLFGLTVLGGAIGALQTGGEGGETISFAVGVTVCAAALAKLAPQFRATCEALLDATRLFESAVPLMCALSAMGGGEQTAAGQAAGMGAAVAVMEFLLSDCLIPLIGVLSAATVFGAVSGDGRFLGIAGMIRGTFLRLMGIVAAVLSGTLALQSTLASAADGALLRAAKYAGGMLPVVGGTVSGSLSTLIGGVHAARSTVGVGILYAILAAALPALCRLLLLRGALGICGAFAGIGPSGAPGRVLRGLGQVDDALTATLCIGVILYVVEVLIFMKSGGGIA